VDINEQMPGHIENPYRHRVAESVVANILHLIATVPNKRRKPILGDLPGDFDFWFDGGAARLVTGYTEYYFADGARATVDVLPVLRVTIKFADGRKVDVRQSWHDDQAG
jgi:hypothetical protein